MRANEGEIGVSWSIHTNSQANNSFVFSHNKFFFVGMMKSKTTAMTLHWVSWMNFYLWTWSQSYKKQIFVRILLYHGQQRQHITLTYTDEYSWEGESLWKKFKDEIWFFVSSEYFHVKSCLATVWGFSSRIWPDYIQEILWPGFEKEFRPSYCHGDAESYNMLSSIYCGAYL